MTAEELVTSIIPFLKEFIEERTLGSDLLIDAEEFRNAPKLFSAAGLGSVDIYSVLECTLMAMDELYIIPKMKKVTEQ